LPGLSQATVVPSPTTGVVAVSTCRHRSERAETGDVDTSDAAMQSIAAHTFDMTPVTPRRSPRCATARLAERYLLHRVHRRRARPWEDLLVLVALAPIVPRIAASAGIPLRHDGPGVALTFDDGPHRLGTSAILAMLELFGAPATFFLVGEQVERHPHIAAALAACGHAIGLHCHRHRIQPRLSAAAVSEDLHRGRAAIEDATGRTPTLHRPPLGMYSAAGLRIAREAGLQPLLWSRWGKDWRRFTTPQRIANRVTTLVAPGDVILLHDADFYSAHDSWRRTLGALPTVLLAIENAGLRPVQPTGSGSAGASS
jgi:peptidoglycan/xylan/chitin deacetylase (PgdA/CDA1 family)